MEKKLHDHTTPPAKVIFGLSNFPSWKNPQHIDHTTNGKEVQGGFITVPAKKAEGAD